MAAQPPPELEPKFPKALAKSETLTTSKQRAAEPEPVNEHEVSDFVALFGCTPEQMSPPIRRLSEASALPGDQTSRIDDGCICKDLLTNMIDGARGGPNGKFWLSGQTLGSFIAGNTECHVCNLIRRHMQHEVRGICNANAREKHRICDCSMSYQSFRVLNQSTALQLLAGCVFRV